MPLTFLPHGWLASSAQGVCATLIRTHTAAIWTHHFPTAHLTSCCSCCALQKGGRFFAIGVQPGNLLDSLLRYYTSLGVVAGIIRCQNCRLECTTYSVANSAYSICTSRTFEISRLPSSGGVGMTWVETDRVEIDRRSESGAAQKLLLYVVRLAWYRTEQGIQLTNSSRSRLNVSMDTLGEPMGEPGSLCSRFSFLLNRSENFLIPPLRSKLVLSRG